MAARKKIAQSHSLTFHPSSPVEIRHGGHPTPTGFTHTASITTPSGDSLSGRLLFPFSLLECRLDRYSNPTVDAAIILACGKRHGVNIRLLDKDLQAAVIYWQM
jgi:hypothetical protein